MACALVSGSALANNCPEINGTFECTSKETGEMVEQTFKTQVVAGVVQYESIDLETGKPIVLIVDGTSRPVPNGDLVLNYVASCPSTDLLEVLMNGEGPIEGGVTMKINLKSTMTWDTSAAGAARTLVISSSGDYSLSSGQTGSMGADTLTCVAR